jgi:hypothetical protein
VIRYAALVTTESTSRNLRRTVRASSAACRASAPSRMTCADRYSSSAACLPSPRLVIRWMACDPFGALNTPSFWPLSRTRSDLTLKSTRHVVIETPPFGPPASVADCLGLMRFKNRPLNAARFSQGGCTALLTATTERNEAAVLSATKDDGPDVLNCQPYPQPFTKGAALAAICAVIPVRSPHFFRCRITGQTT